MRITKIFLLLFSLLYISSCGVKQKKESPVEGLKPQGYVNDYAGVLSEPVKAKLENIISRFEKQTTIEIAVVILKELKDYSIEEAAVELFEKWGIGKKDKDNGVLLILSLKERKVKIEVGYGLEGIIPDSVAGRILDIYGVPFLKNNEFDKGIYATVIGIIGRISQKLNIKFNFLAGNIAPQGYTERPHRGGAISLLPLFVILIVLFRFGLWWFFPFFFIGGGSGYGSGGGFGGFSGGFSGFGGGLSGGGGATRGF